MLYLGQATGFARLEIMITVFQPANVATGRQIIMGHLLRFTKGITGALHDQPR